MRSENGAVTDVTTSLWIVRAEAVMWQAARKPSVSS